MYRTGKAQDLKTYMRRMKSGDLFQEAPSDTNPNKLLLLVLRLNLHNKLVLHHKLLSDKPIWNASLVRSVNGSPPSSATENAFHTPRLPLEIGKCHRNTHFQRRTRARPTPKLLRRLVSVSGICILRI